MVWPILISVAVTPRISAEVAANGSIRQTTTPSAPNPKTQRIETQRIDQPSLLPPRSDGAVAAEQTCHGAVVDATVPQSPGIKKRGVSAASLIRCAGRFKPAAAAPDRDPDRDAGATCRPAG